MAATWPGDVRCVVDLSFDLEGRTPWIQRDPEFLKLPGILSMGDYGPRVGARRILDLLGTYDIKATFSAPATIAEEHTDLIREIHFRGHELINHGYVHEPPTSLTSEQEVDILERSRALSRRFAEAVAGWVPELGVVPVEARRWMVIPDLFRSDHAPFWRAGIPAIMITDTANFRSFHYHKPTDTPDTLDYTFLHRG